ncbi:MAG: 50S ribosomal protein L29 [Flavobacteriaceae bacterium]|nr:50S ribosomal protein L29 [Flavobacteriaceae bacterium]
MKQTEINELSIEELNEKLTTTQKSYENARATHALSPLENPIAIRQQRRTIARIKTELSKRTKEQA